MAIILAKVGRTGTIAQDSIGPTVDGETPTRRASFRWLMPAMRLARRSRPAIGYGPSLGRAAARASADWARAGSAG